MFLLTLRPIIIKSFQFKKCIELKIKFESGTFFRVKKLLEQCRVTGNFKASYYFIRLLLDNLKV